MGLVLLHKVETFVWVSDKKLNVLGLTLLFRHYGEFKLGVAVEVYKALDGLESRGLDHGSDT